MINTDTIRISALTKPHTPLDTTFHFLLISIFAFQTCFHVFYSLDNLVYLLDNLNGAIITNNEKCTLPFYNSFLRSFYVFEDSSEADLIMLVNSQHLTKVGLFCLTVSELVIQFFLLLLLSKQLFTKIEYAFVSLAASGHHSLRYTISRIFGNYITRYFLFSIGCFSNVMIGLVVRIDEVSGDLCIHDSFATASSPSGATLMYLYLFGTLFRLVFVLFALAACFSTAWNKNDRKCVRTENEISALTDFMRRDFMENLLHAQHNGPQSYDCSIFHLFVAVESELSISFYWSKKAIRLESDLTIEQLLDVESIRKRLVSTYYLSDCANPQLSSPWSTAGALLFMFLTFVGIVSGTASFVYVVSEHDNLFFKVVFGTAQGFAVCVTLLHMLRLEPKKSRVMPMKRKLNSTTKESGKLKNLPSLEIEIAQSRKSKYDDLVPTAREKGDDIVFFDAVDVESGMETNCRLVTHVRFEDRVMKNKSQMKIKG